MPEDTSSDYGTLEPLGSNMSRQKDEIFNSPFLEGGMGVADQDSIPNSGIVATTRATIGNGETIEIEDMLAIVATEKITIEAGATIDGEGGSTREYGTYGQNGVYEGGEWLPKAYIRCVCEARLDIAHKFEHPLVGGGANGSGSGGAALLLAAPTVEIQAPSTIKLRGVNGGNDGHFGIVYQDQFAYDGQAETGGEQSFITPEKIDSTEI